MTPPKITIVMATYDWSEVLPFSIGSALGQTFSDFELIVVGDGCSDDSEQVVAAVGDPRVRWINLPSNTGHQSAPNNEGIRSARGELIAYLGHDDLWLPHHLECLVEAIDAGADMAYGITRLVGPPDDEENQVICPQYRPGLWVPPTSVVHRRSLIDRVGGWRHYREVTCDPEVDLWSRFHAAGARISLVPRLTAIKFPAARRRDVYRQRPNHEQAAWLARIREERDFEQVELGRMLAATVAEGQARSYGALASELLRRTAAGVARRLVRPAPGETIDRLRRYKGAGPRSKGDAGVAASD